MERSPAMTESSPTTVMDSRILSEVSQIPAINSLLNAYEKTKNYNSLVFNGFSFAEKGFRYVASSLYIDSFAGCYVDDVVGGKLADLKESYPILQKPPKTILKKTRKNSVRFVKQKTRSALDNYVGKKFVHGLDTVVSASSQTLKYLDPHKSGTRKRNVYNSGNDSIQTSEKQVQTGETNGKSSKHGPDMTSWIEKITEEKVSIVDQIMLFTLIPLKWFVKWLKTVQKLVHPPGFTTLTPKRRKSKRNAKTKTLSPEQMAEIGARRKISPKKRLNSASSILGNIKNATYRMLGFGAESHVKQTDIRQFLRSSKRKDLNECPAVLGDEKEKKRKQPEDSATDSSDSDEDLINMDLKNYVSDEDPDYEPTDDSDENDVTIGSQDEETESDLEIEETEGKYLQIKDKSVKNRVTMDKNENKTGDKNGVTMDKNDNKTGDKVKITENIKTSKENQPVKSSPMKTVVSTTKPNQSAPSSQVPVCTQSTPAHTSSVTKSSHGSPAVSQSNQQSKSVPSTQQQKTPVSQHAK